MRSIKVELNKLNRRESRVQLKKYGVCADLDEDILPVLQKREVCKNRVFIAFLFYTKNLRRVVDE
jgi:hypothetical protein